MFEPIHGSAPDIAGQGLANPVGMLWAVVLMLEHLDLKPMADLLFKAMRTTLKAGIKTPDIGGHHTTAEVVDAIYERLGG
jgi:tartrate dehydrogenase/decarboxylase/D-malate dehydrogenase